MLGKLSVPLSFSMMALLSIAPAGASSLGSEGSAKGGHFAAWEEPQIFAEELRAAFKSVR